MSASLHPVSGTADELTQLLLRWDQEPDPQPLIITTSGSTGRPKSVVLSRDAMRASAEATHRYLGGPGPWVLTVPPTYVAGVQVLYRSIVAGVEPIILGAAPLTDVPDPAGAYLAMVPTQLVRLLRPEAAAELAVAARFAAILIGGAALDPAARSQAEAAGLRIVATYGMSETCGGCVYDGYPLDGVRIKVDDAGQVWLAGPMLFDGYAGEPDRTAAVLQNGWFATDDLGELAPDGKLTITGRRDDVIISGGLNIPVLAVKAQVSEYLRARGTAAPVVEVLGAPDAEWGQRVVVATTSPIDIEELRGAVEPRTWAPKQVLVLPELPQLGSGKIDRLKLQELAQMDGRDPKLT